MKRKIKAGTTSLALPIFLRDTSSTTGAGLGSIVYNTSGLVAEYRRQGQSSWTTISLASGTLGTFVSGGFVADGSLTGAYEFCPPNAAVASGARWVLIRLRGAANMLPVLIELELDAVDYQDSGAFGLSTLINANSNASNAASYSLSGWQAVLQVGTQALMPFGSSVKTVGTNRGINSFRARNLSTDQVYNYNSEAWETWDDTTAAAGYYDLPQTPLDSVSSAIDLVGFGIPLVVGYTYNVEAVDYNNYGSGWTGPMLWDGTNLSTIATAQDAANAIKAKTDNLPASPANEATVVVGISAVLAAIPSATTIAAAVWAALTSGLTTVGSIGKWIIDKLDVTVSTRASQASVDALAASDPGVGLGDILVDENTGGTGNLRYVDGSGNGIEAEVTAYLASEYAADAQTAVARGRSHTDSNGDWIKKMKLYAGSYTIAFDAAGYELATVDVEVT